MHGTNTGHQPRAHPHCRPAATLGSKKKIQRLSARSHGTQHTGMLPAHHPSTLLSALENEKT
jgi:hypothetical protein